MNSCHSQRDRNKTALAFAVLALVCSMVFTLAIEHTGPDHDQTVVIQNLSDQIESLQLDLAEANTDIAILFREKFGKDALKKVEERLRKIDEESGQTFARLITLEWRCNALTAADEGFDKTMKESDARMTAALADIETRLAAIPAQTDYSRQIASVQCDISSFQKRTSALFKNDDELFKWQLDDSKRLNDLVHKYVDLVNKSHSHYSRRRWFKCR